MKRVYHHYEKWEEIHAGMWRNIPSSERSAMLDKAEILMKDTDQFLSAMQRAITEWTYSCEHHLTGGFNRQAWIGHAGCCIAIASPEDVTREAWHRLTQEEQERANAAADQTIADWEVRYSQKGVPCQKQD